MTAPTRRALQREAAAWRLAAEEFVTHEMRGFSPTNAFVVTGRLYDFFVIDGALLRQMEGRLPFCMRVSDEDDNANALACLWLALECEEEAANAR
jgi:hypothetical protein